MVAKDNENLRVRSIKNHNYEVYIKDAYPLDHELRELWVENYYNCKLRPVWDGDKQNIAEGMVVFCQNLSIQELALVNDASSPLGFELLGSGGDAYFANVDSLFPLNSQEYLDNYTIRVNAITSNSAVNGEDKDQQAPKAEIIKTFPKVSVGDDLIWVSRKDPNLKGSGRLEHDNKQNPDEREFCVSRNDKLSILNVSDFAIIRYTDVVNTTIMIENLNKQLPHLSDADIHDLINQIRSCPVE